MRNSVDGSSLPGHQSSESVVAAGCGYGPVLRRWEDCGGSTTWTTDEDETLSRLVREYGAKQWTVISTMMDHRTGKQCRERWRNHLDPGIRNDPFTAEEDALIVKRVAELGTKWAEIARSFRGRSDNSIKNRYYSRLHKRNYQRKLSRFNKGEDLLILDLVARVGTKWSEIAKHLPGRTSKSIKNRYYSALKKNSSYYLSRREAASCAPKAIVKAMHKASGGCGGFDIDEGNDPTGRVVNGRHEQARSPPRIADSPTPSLQGSPFRGAIEAEFEPNSPDVVGFFKEIMPLDDDCLSTDLLVSAALTLVEMSDQRPTLL